MITCEHCDRSTEDTATRFCGFCGERFSDEARLPFIGEPVGRGIFRVTFPPQEGEFCCEEDVRIAVRSSVWDVDNRFTGEIRVEFVRSTVTPETHPLECGTCKDDPDIENTVSSTDRGRCEQCDTVNWLLRTD